MAETMGSMKRTGYCGTAGGAGSAGGVGIAAGAAAIPGGTAAEIANVGDTVTVGGFVKKSRRLGSNLIFIDLRDRTGIVQLAFDDSTPRDVFEKALQCRSEFVLIASGEVRAREKANPDIPTGAVEIAVSEMKILSKAETTPFEIVDDSNANEELRLKYRYLDLRRQVLQKNMITRGKITKIARDYFYDNGFLELDTPCLMKSTPEGARDYLVPSRIHPGEFYALPQSPQIYKQLLMISGFDRYVQIAKCFRDEDLRADRQPEFMQIDLEMSFVDVDDILNTAEGFIAKLFDEVLGVNIPLPLPRITYTEAMEKYGSDKPDTRFGNTIEDVTEVLKDTEFGVFNIAISEGGVVCAVNIKNSASVYTRKEMDKLIEYAKGIGAGGIPYIRWADEKPNCSFAKFLPEGKLDEILTATGAEKGDIILFAAGKKNKVLPLLGALRNVTAAKLSIIPDTFNFLWVVDFPFFEFNEETSNWDAMHHPFTMPKDECLEYLETAPEKVFAKAFDLVVNGTELSSGSMRITDYELQQKMFRLLGLTPEEIEAKFGFLVDAYKYGAPPHGGMGIGLDRLAMIVCGADSLRDVTAFPKVQNASELMSGCPSPVDSDSLDILGIAIK
ncbi:MAG: aspartate--tRNA ligase [Ruminococcus sp.]|jgi:aspartyl-tRNA synthetase|nr:aspartate--tRNA ligase [Ruminococcus sp.]